MADAPGDSHREKLFAEEHERLIASDLWWREKGSDLRSAAEAVWESWELQRPPYLMLCGMSLESLYKAIAVARGKRPRYHHKLVELAAYAEFPVAESDRGALRLLTAAIYWNGKYPVPKESGDLAEYGDLFHSVMSDVVPSSGSLRVLRPNNALDWEHFCRLWSVAERFFWKTRAR